MISSKTEIIIVSDDKDYYRLYELMQAFTLTEQYVELDLTQHKFYTPMKVLILTQFIIFLKRKGKEVSVTLNSKNKYTRYIEGIGLFEFCRKNIDSPTTHNGIHSQTAMPIRRINTENMTEYITMAADYFSLFAPSKDLTILNISISELVNNVVDHSKSDIDAYIFCQYYKSKNEIAVVVSDIGIGIPSSVNQYLKGIGKENLSEQECVEWALTQNYSSKTKPHNRGAGLSNIVSFCENTVSSLRIMTNNIALVMVNGKKKYFIQKKKIKGTIVEIIFSIDSLDDKNTNEYFDY